MTLKLLHIKSYPEITNRKNILAIKWTYIMLKFYSDNDNQVNDMNLVVFKKIEMECIICKKIGLL